MTPTTPPAARSERLLNTEDLIDSRDVIARMDYLDSLDGLPSEREYRERRGLTLLAEDAESAPDWEYGETLIRETYFVQYVQELVEDCGYVPTDLPGFIHIDWERTAREVRMDYFEVDFDGATYLVRA